MKPPCTRRMRVESAWISDASARRSSNAAATRGYVARQQHATATCNMQPAVRNMQRTIRRQRRLYDAQDYTNATDVHRYNAKRHSIRSLTCLQPAAGSD